METEPIGVLPSAGAPSALSPHAPPELLVLADASRTYTIVACGVPTPMLAVPLTGTWTGAPSARNCVPSAGLSMLTCSAAPFGSVVLLEPAQAGRAASSAMKPRTAVRRAPRRVVTFPFTESFPLTSRCGAAGLAGPPRGSARCYWSGRLHHLPLV